MNSLVKNIFAFVTALAALTAGAQEFNLSFQYTATSSAQFNPTNAPLAQGAVVDTLVSRWNTIDAGGQSTARTFGPVALVSSDGTSSNIIVSGTAGYCWANDISPTNHTKDWVMMDSWFGFKDTEALNVTGIPESFQTNGYKVVIYGDCGVSRTMNYTLGGITNTIKDTGTFNGSFVAGSNTVIFSGLHLAAFSITGNQTSSVRSAINGLRILPDPPDPKIVSFTVNHRYLPPGDTATLCWQVENANTVVIEPALGDVTPLTTNGAGSCTLPITTNTVFTITAKREEDDPLASATLTVRTGSPPPNLLVFLVDDMGWQDTSVPFNYNAAGNAVISSLNQRYRTPSMERLAASGMRFTAAYANPVCSPTRVSIMTGKSSARHHVTNWTTGTGAEPSGSDTPDLKPPSGWLRTGMASTETNTLPHLLAQAGYRTIHVGKAHFGSIGSYAQYPQNIGFNVNIAGSEIGNPASYYGTNDFGTGSNHVPGLEAYHGQDIFLTEALTLEMNKQLESAVTNGVPFFAYMAHYAVHVPWDQDGRFATNYSKLTATQRAFATLIEGMDKSLGDILNKLEALGVAENTLVVFLSDNGGDNINTPLREKKGTLYEGGVRVPMIWSWAKTNAANSFQAALPIASGSRQTDSVLAWDIYSTLLGVAGVAVTAPVDGEDLRGYLRGTPGFHRTQQFAIHYPHYRTPQDPGSLWRDGDWKLIYNYQTGTGELYNVASDLSETNNLAAFQPERVMAMSRALARDLNRLGALFPQRITNSVSVPPVMPNLPLLDLDNDGLPDLQEDVNANGLWDDGETDPGLSDTDGDHTPDGAEIRTGTDPLNPASNFIVSRSASSGLPERLFWPSKAGASYRIEKSSSLTPVSWEIVTNNVPGVTGQTFFDPPIHQSGGAAQFYRVILK